MAAVGDGLQIVPHPQSDGVALLSSVLLARQVDLDLANVVALAKIIVPHEAVEIHRRGEAHVAGEIGDFGHARQVSLHFADRRVRAFQRRALVEVQHQEQFVLVVKRQHFQRYAPHRRQAHRPKGQKGHDQQERPSGRRELRIRGAMRG